MSGDKALFILPEKILKKQNSVIIIIKKKFCPGVHWKEQERSSTQDALGLLRPLLYQV